jgi:hypothetical protein
VVVTELLELPWRQDERVTVRDAMAETILSDPRLTEALRPVLAVIGERANDLSSGTGCRRHLAVTQALGAPPLRSPPRCSRSVPVH